MADQSKQRRRTVTIIRDNHHYKLQDLAKSGWCVTVTGDPAIQPNRDLFEEDIEVTGK